MSIGPRVRERRKAQRLSQEQLASQAGLTWSAIQRLEAEQVTDPHYSTLSSIAHVLGTTVAELVGEEPAVGKVSPPPETGQPPLEVLEGLLKRALKAHREDEEKQQRAVNRLKASEGTLKSTHISEFAEDPVREELRSLAETDPDGYFEYVTWPLVMAVNHQEKQLEEQEKELSRLRNLVAENERLKATVAELRKELKELAPS
jgi:transcriptional regulator with XRE-family HTH domain